MSLFRQKLGKFARESPEAKAMLEKLIKEQQEKLLVEITEIKVVEQAIKQRKIKEDRYVNDFHRQSSEASLKAVAKMLQNPLTREQMLAQEERRTTEHLPNKRKWKTLQ